uniref:ferroxidase n=1 Tax=Varanus komodoensis TaxID=61221 RepID=A0A8D2INB2_VARKO
MSETVCCAHFTKRSRGGSFLSSDWTGATPPGATGVIGFAWWVLSPSQMHQNYQQHHEAASSVYLSVFCCFDTDAVALEKFAKCFLLQSHEGREHAEMLMKLQDKRGGRWVDGRGECVALKKDVSPSLLEPHKLATGKNDPISHRMALYRRHKQPYIIPQIQNIHVGKEKKIK